MLRHLVDVVEGVDRGGPGVHADMGMIHDGPVGLAARLVFGLRGHAKLLAEEGASQGEIGRDGAAFHDQRTGGREFSGQQLPDAAVKVGGRHSSRSHALHTKSSS